MTENDFKRVLDGNPDLCADGLRAGVEPERFEQLRAELYGRFDAFCQAVEWLEGQKQRKTVNRSRTSMEVKHDIPGGVRHGAFIAAAIYLGIPMVPCGASSPKCVYLGLSDSRKLA